MLIAGSSDLAFGTGGKSRLPPDYFERHLRGWLTGTPDPSAA